MEFYLFYIISASFPSARYILLKNTQEVVAPISPIERNNATLNLMGHCSWFFETGMAHLT